jgi:hypothetical protein
MSQHGIFCALCDSLIANENNQRYPTKAYNNPTTTQTHLNTISQHYLYLDSSQHDTRQHSTTFNNTNMIFNNSLNATKNSPTQPTIHHPTQPTIHHPTQPKIKYTRFIFLILHEITINGEPKALCASFY